jgi:hypothetical protein
MNRERFQSGGLIRLHQVLWYAIFVFFFIVCLVYAFDSELSARIAFWGVILIIAGTVARVIVLSELFRRSHRYGLWSLCGVLLLVLIGTILLRFVD